MSGSLAGQQQAKAQQQSFGLQSGALGPVETLAQSVSAMAPSTSASLTIPLVFALAGNGTWFVYLLATAATLLIGLSISRFARMSATPGSLYSYTAETLPAFWGQFAGWGLLAAYIGTGASVAGGALYYARLLGTQFAGWAPPAVPLLVVVCAVAALVAWRDVKLSAELMLWIEVLSVGLVLLVLLAMLWANGFHVDLDQLHLTGVAPAALGPALVLAMFSFAGFESATTLGAEARNPLRTIPRAVLQCALLAGVFFMLSAYAEVLGFRGAPGSLSDSTSPMHLLAIKAHLAPVGIAIDFGAAVSMFACVLACLTASARVMLPMARAGLLPARLAATSPRHGTPGAAIVVAALLMCAATSGLALVGASGSEMYDWMGSVAVFGFLTAYALVAVALPVARRRAGAASSWLLSLVTVAVVALILVYDLRSASDAVHARLPWVYIGYVALGLLWSWARTRRLSEV